MTAVDGATGAPPGSSGATAEDRLERLIAAWPDGIVEIDRRGTVVGWNAAAEGLLGWSRAQVVGTFAGETLLFGAFAHTPVGLLLAGDGRGEAVDVQLDLRHRDGHLVRARARLVASGAGRGRTVSGFLRPAVERVRVAAPDDGLHDRLTGLANGILFGTTLAQAVEESAATPGSLAVVLLDLDRFTAINSSVGHAGGDAVLTALARRLAAATGEVDLVARRGGDQFLALVREPYGAAGLRAAALTDRIRLALAQPVAVEGGEVFLAASIGVALNTFGVDDPDVLLAHAEGAMEQAKRRGGSRVETFGESLRIQVLDRMATEHSLHRALERRELMLHYQPVVELAGSRTVGVEALIRWDHPDRGLVPPNRFIAVAEESGLIVPIGAWVLEQACHQLRAWHARGPVGPRGSVEVNLSARQIDDPEIVRTVESILTRTGLPPECLTLEITESALMRDAGAALVVLRALKELGVLLAIDDFGAGYSSLSYLQRFPLDILKIDRMFVEELGVRSGAREIVAAVINLAHALRLQVVAEGVETERQLAVLQSLGCDLAQGFLFSHPLPAAELRVGVGVGVGSGLAASA